MTFNIIYTPNSVAATSFFIGSLLEYSDFNFRLVSNGCTIKERNQLTQLSESNCRLSYHCYPTNKCAVHGHVLNYLQAMTDEDYFCFMDSDIFAFSKISLADFMYKNAAAYFSAMPIWVKDSECNMSSNFHIMSGNFNMLDNNQCIGGSYFAVYNNTQLTEIMQHYSVGFEQCRLSQLSIEAQQILKSINFRQSIFDTGKAINVLMNSHGLKLTNIDLSNLIHLGGLSFETSLRKNKTWKENVKNNLQMYLPNSVLPKSIKTEDWSRFIKYYKDTPQEEYEINYNQKIVRRNLIRQYFLQVFNALKNNINIPDLPKIEDEEIQEKLVRAQKTYVMTYKDHFSNLHLD